MRSGWSLLKKIVLLFKVELQQPEWPPSWALYPYTLRKAKETHKLIFLWLSLLAVYYSRVGMQDDDGDDERVVQDGSHTPANRLTETCVLLWYWTSMLWSIDTRQNIVSAYLESHVHIAGSSLELIKVTCFLMLTSDQVLIFHWIPGSYQVNL